MNNLFVFGYIDPGSGFILLQVILAGIIGSMVFFRNMLWWAVGLVTGRGKKKDELIAADPPPAVSAEAGLVGEKREG
jgi:hypothetical protein